MFGMAIWLPQPNEQCQGERVNMKDLILGYVVMLLNVNDSQNTIHATAKGNPYDIISGI